MTLWTKSRRFLQPWSPRPPEGERWDDGKRFDAMMRERRLTTRKRYYICSRDGGSILGCASVSGIERGVFHSAHLGWWIGAPHARRGYMTEALPLLLREAFETLGLHRVEANIRPENTPSRRLARRAGFRREGLALRFLRIDGVWRDHERWAMTVEEWRVRSQAPITTSRNRVRARAAVTPRSRRGGRLPDTRE